jgi:protein-disulfide isomerase
MGSSAVPAAVPTPTSRLKWIAPAWFFFGILVGVIGFAAYNALIVKPASTAAAAPTFDVVAMRNAARDGTLDAIATLQPAAAQQQQQPQGPQVVAANAFTVRDANRQGNPDAKVTIYEFSDFQ